MSDDHLPPHVRQLTKAQLMDRVPELRAAVMAVEGLTRNQKAHLVQLLMLLESFQSTELQYLEEMIELVKKARLQSEAFRKALLWDLSAYFGASAEDRRKTKDRVFSCLKGAPPEDPKLGDEETVFRLAGKEYTTPDRFK